MTTDSLQHTAIQSVQVVFISIVAYFGMTSHINALFSTDIMEQYQQTVCVCVCVRMHKRNVSAGYHQP